MYNFNIEEFNNVIKKTITQVDDFEGFSLDEIYEKILLKNVLRYYAKNFTK